MTVKQDRVRPRTPVDVERKYKLSQIKKTAEEVEELKEERVVDSYLSITSTNPVENKVITDALNQKVNKTTGKDLSTNDFTNEYKDKLDSISTHTHENKEVLDSITEKMTSENRFNLSDYKVDTLTINQSSCMEKQYRVCMNVSCKMTVNANEETTLFNLPSELLPTTNKNFVVFCNGIVGLGEIKTTGELVVTFTQEISENIVFNVTYDKE